MNRPYSEATRERVARAIHNRRHGADINSALADSLWEDADVRRHAYELADAAVAAAGLLLPEGAETRGYEYASEHQFLPPAGFQRMETGQDRSLAELRLTSWAPKSVPSRLVRREVIVGPWTPVEAVGLAVGDSKPTGQDPSVSIEETPQ